MQTGFSLLEDHGRHAKVKHIIHSRSNKYSLEEIFREDVSRLSQTFFPQSYLTHFRDVRVIDVTAVYPRCIFTTRSLNIFPY